MQNWMTGLIIATCMLYGFLLVTKYEQHQPEASTSATAALAPASPADNNKPAAQTETAALRFGGYPCGGDCSVQQEGYRWAERNNVTDPDSCTGSSAEFIEGCRVYALKRSGTG